MPKEKLTVKAHSIQIPSDGTDTRPVDIDGQIKTRKRKNKRKQKSAQISNKDIPVKNEYVHQGICKAYVCTSY
jgi:hypothetical protein